MHLFALTRDRRVLSIVVLAVAVSISCGKKDIEATGAAPTAAVPPLTPGISLNLTRQNGVPLHVFDSLGLVTYPEQQKSVQVPGNTDIAAQGWALDEANNTTAGGVDVVLDQVPYNARYGILRGDVAAHFNRPDYANSGFQLVLGQGRLTKGQHSISIRVISSDKKSYREGPVVMFTLN